MGKIIKESWVETRVEYDLVFYYDDNGGFAFPCTATGELLPDLHQAAIDNYTWALANPDKFAIFNEVRKSVYKYRHGATVECSCGEQFEVHDQYMGACACPKCDRWYSLNGQNLIPPEYWED